MVCTNKRKQHYKLSRILGNLSADINCLTWQLHYEVNDENYKEATNVF